MRDVSILTDNGVDLNGALELLGDLSFYDETLEAFLSENETRLPNIAKYKKEQKTKVKLETIWFAIIETQIKVKFYLGFLRSFLYF